MILFKKLLIFFSKHRTKEHFEKYEAKLQEIIDRGFKVHILEFHKGWIEVHNKKDLELAEKLI